MDRPSSYKQLASGAGNVQIHDKPTRVTGFSVTAAVAATVTLHDGTGAGDPIIGQIVLGAAGADIKLLPKVQVSAVFVERSAAAQVTVFLNSN